jgi:hypothetical protein
MPTPDHLCYDDIGPDTQIAMSLLLEHEGWEHEEWEHEREGEKLWSPPAKRKLFSPLPDDDTGPEEKFETQQANDTKGNESVQDMASPISSVRVKKMPPLSAKPILAKSRRHKKILLPGQLCIESFLVKMPCPRQDF